jgi:hypothetical protein
MELEELINDLKNFKNFTEFNPIYVKGSDLYSKGIYEFTEQKINQIDTKLNELKASNEEKYQIIINKYLPILIKILKSDFFVEHYPFGTFIFEAHLENDNPPTEIELKSYIQRVSFLNETGIIDFLLGKYPELKNNNLKFTQFLTQFLNVKIGTLQPIINALRSGQTANKNYPKPTNLVKSLIEKYTI